MVLVGAFLQELHDHAEAYDDIAPGEQVRAAFELNKSLREIEEAGFTVFGGREIQRLEGGVDPPSNWPIAHVRILRADNPAIVRVNSDSAHSD
jgi:hypothetical protein